MTIRAQRKRTRNWKKPIGAVYIGRPGRYGNPFDWQTLQGGKQEAQKLFGKWLPGAVAKGEYEIESLRDKTIMCWCDPDEPCHGDITISVVVPVCGLAGATVHNALMKLNEGN